MGKLENNLLNGLKIAVTLIIAIRLFFVVFDNKFKQVQAIQEQNKKQEVILPEGEKEVDILLNGGRDQEAFIAATVYFAEIYKKSTDPIEKRRIIVKRNSYFKRILDEDLKVLNWTGTLKNKQVLTPQGDLNIAISIAQGITISGYENRFDAREFSTDIKANSPLAELINAQYEAGKKVTFSGRFIKNWQTNFNGNHHILIADNKLLAQQDEASLMTELNLYFKLERIEIAP